MDASWMTGGEMANSKGLSAQRAFELRQVVLARWTPEVFNRFQCVWLGHSLGLAAPEIAQVLGLNVATVRRIRTEFIRHGTRAIEGKGNRGGRRNHYLSPEEETEFLKEHAGLLQRAGSAGVTALKAALEARLGQPVHKTTIYRLLERHGLKKGAPRAGAASDQAPSRRRGTSASPRRRKSQRPR
ncbi:MAG TPA: helix-turn-helix domain-containing protein [Geobacteraceae bacterium]